MAYEAKATRTTPALIIYLIDVSSSMAGQLDGDSKINHVNKALERLIVRMVHRATKGEQVSPRYRVAMIAYHSTPQDILGGIQTIEHVAQKGTPILGPSAATDTAAAFIVARDMLKQELPKIDGHPAPLVCHLTDGEYNGPDPEPIAREIMQMSNKDGNVLVSNIFVSSGLTKQPIADARAWPGIISPNELTNRYAVKLYNMSSPLPPSYARVIQEEEYSIQAGARMLFPAASKDLIELAFVASAATEVG